VKHINFKTGFVLACALQSLVGCHRAAETATEYCGDPVEVRMQKGQLTCSKDGAACWGVITKVCPVKSSDGGNIKSDWRAGQELADAELAPSFAHGCFGEGCKPQPWIGETCDTPEHLMPCTPQPWIPPAVTLVACPDGRINCVADVMTWTVQ